MQVLCVNGYENSKKGTENFNGFVRSVMSCLHELIKTSETYGEHNVINRRMNNLTDYVVDWDHDILDDKARDACHAFDKIDAVCVGGDMKVFPWDPLCSQVVTLLHMCNKTSKPTVCCGSGGFMMVYASATGGKRFYMLNGPHGQSVDKLPYFPRYASTGGTSGAYPSGWLDNETGDVYSFDPALKQWDPVCNIGMYKLKYGSKAVPHEKKYARNNLVLTPVQKPLQESVAHIRSHCFTQHLEKAPVAGLPAQNFVVTLLPDWHLSWDGSLPTLAGMHIVADGPHGPVVLFMDNKLVLACEFKDGPNFGPIRRILVNFFEDMVHRMKKSPFRIDSSLELFLFQEQGRLSMPSMLRTRKSFPESGHTDKDKDFGASSVDPASFTKKTSDFRIGRVKSADECGKRPSRQQIRPDLSLVMASGLACTAIPTKLPSGPTKIDIPNMTVFIAGKQKVDAPLAIYTAGTPNYAGAQTFSPSGKKNATRDLIQNLNSEITLPRKCSTAVGRPASSRSIQNPSAFRRNRLETMMKDSCVKMETEYTQQLLNDTTVQSQEENPYGFEQQMPDSARELYAGVYNRQTDSKNVNLKHRTPHKPSSAPVTPAGRGRGFSIGTTPGKPTTPGSPDSIMRGTREGWKELFAQPVEDRVSFSDSILTNMDASDSDIARNTSNTSALVTKETPAYLNNSRPQSSSNWRDCLEEINSPKKDPNRVENPVKSPFYVKVEIPQSPAMKQKGEKVLIPSVVPKLQLPYPVAVSYLPGNHPLSARSASVDVTVSGKTTPRGVGALSRRQVGIHLPSPIKKPINNLQ